jgi:MoaA/NifB/PqqE/SkfB family radical SAM enzyme
MSHRNADRISEKKAYIVLGYACNHECSGCPCSNNQREDSFFEYSDIISSIDRFIFDGVNDITISGGEPTVHPKFFDVVDYISKKKIKLNLLTNADRFSDPVFLKKFVACADYTSTTIITTFHSCKPKDHELQNGSEGSFIRTLRGLKNLISNHIQVIIKHCITKRNYEQLPAFIKFIEDEFSPAVDLQIWGFDYSGLSAEQASDFYISFKNMREYFECAIDLFEEFNKHENKRRLTINELPLCLCEPYYWKYFSPRKNILYDNYSVPTNEYSENVNRNSDTASFRCAECIVKNMCMGTYKSAFEMFGDSIVAFDHKLTSLTKFKPDFRLFNDRNNKLLYLSPYIRISLSKMGFTVFNSVTKDSLDFNLRNDEFTGMLELFKNGLNLDSISQASDVNSKHMPSIFQIEEMTSRGILE